MNTDEIRPLFFIQRQQLGGLFEQVGWETVWIRRDRADADRDAEGVLNERIWQGSDELPSRDVTDEVVKVVRVVTGEEILAEGGEDGLARALRTPMAASALQRIEADSKL